MRHVKCIDTPDGLRREEIMVRGDGGEEGKRVPMAFFCPRKRFPSSRKNYLFEDVYIGLIKIRERLVADSSYASTFLP